MKSKWKQLLPYILIPLSLILVLSLYSAMEKKEKTEYYEIIQMFYDGEVSEYSLNLGNGDLEYKLRDDKDTVKNYTVPNVNMFIEDVHESVKGYNQLNPDNPIQFDWNPGSNTSYLLTLLPGAVLIISLVLIMVYMFRKTNQTMTNESNRAISFGKAKVKHGKDQKNKTTFADVAGADEEKEELEEIVEYLKNPLKFNDLGARIPKGVLLVGPPGTGKTLLSRAVAGEANVPFFSISGSDFVEMYVGVGASRVRDLFDQAKKTSPAIIFIDEIDAVGRHRGAGMGGGHDEREQTLNQLLVEMDGFGANEGIIILAATNRPDILDPALLRPGRFDRQITVGYPDVRGREEILKVHSRKKPLSADVRLEVIAKSTVGFTGADLENLLNEAALLAARRDLKAITMTEIEEATIKILVGTEKKSRKSTPKDRNLTAYHEAGHAVAAYFLETQDPVHQISIISRGMAGGYTMSIPVEDRSYISRTTMMENIVSLLGGRVAESVVLGDISTGASNDIERATEIARNMVTKYGMSEILGPINFGSGHNEVFLGKDYGSMRNYSELTASEIDAEINKIITEAYEKGKVILLQHIDKLHLVANTLLEFEKIDAEVFNKLMSPDYNSDSLPEELQKQRERNQTISDVVIAEDSHATSVMQSLETSVSKDDFSDNKEEQED